MTNLCCVFRLISILVAFSACSGYNQEVIEKDIPVLEEGEEESTNIDCKNEMENSPKKLPRPTKRKRHKFGDHFILDRIMTSVEALSVA